MRREKGITLIALVITIIILLILAGISIATITGENGLLTKANAAKTETKKANAEEQVKIAVAGSFDNEGKLSADKVKEELRKIPNVGEIRDTNRGFPIEVDLDGYTFVIEGNGNVTRKVVKPVVDYNLSTDEQVEEGTEVTVTITATIGEGEKITKITKPDGKSVTNTNTTSFPVTTNGVYIVTVEGSNGETTTKQIAITNIGTTEIFSDIYTSTQTYTDGNKTAVIPEGFAIGISSTINKIENGLVITDAIDENHKSIGNEFVWVPVENFNNFIRVSGYISGNPQTCTFTTTGLTSGQYYEPVGDGIAKETEVEKMYKSVKDNKGFYIGRYEAGSEGENEDKKVVVKKNKPVYNAVPWSNSKDMTVLTGGAVELAKNFIKDKTYKGKVTSTLIYGVQWDATLKFFNDESYLKDGKGKGWYQDNYSTGNPNHLTGIGVDSNASNKVRNIYDMAGNVSEWTMEAHHTNYRVSRGGDYNSDGSQDPASYRDSYSPFASGGSIGFRLALYVDV